MAWSERIRGILKYLAGKPEVEFATIVEGSKLSHFNIVLEVTIADATKRVNNGL